MIHIDTAPWSLETVETLLKSGKEIGIDDSIRTKINENRTFLESKIENTDSPIYGVNTGFGALCDTVISDSDLTKLQRNIVLSHACGTGAEVDSEIVRLMLLLKIKSLVQGFSGVRVEVIDSLVSLYNHGVTPVVYEQGSLGASGDLAPLAHIALTMIGEGTVYAPGGNEASTTVLERKGIKPLTLRAKEGLAILNGTQFMAAHGVSVLNQLKTLGSWADLIGAMSLEAYAGRLDAFDGKIGDVRPHSGQLKTASNVREILEGSSIGATSDYTQDPYSFRCIPQVHGACKDAASHVKHVVEVELNSVTDNPTVFESTGEVISGGNFHGQPLAMAYDYLALAIAELGSISERRSYKLLSGERGLQPFLATNPGLESGYMIPQYTAASIVSQNKQLASPASVDTIDSSNGQEDHVSMGANGATRLVRMMDNLATLLGIELLLAVKAHEQKGLTSSKSIEVVKTEFRTRVAAQEGDSYLRPQIIDSAEFLKQTNPADLGISIDFF